MIWLILGLVLAFLIISGLIGATSSSLDSWWVPVAIFWLIFSMIALSAFLIIIGANQVAHADPCYLPPEVPARIAPSGMPNYMWPPCDSTGDTWSRTTLWSQECVYPEGNPDGSWCWYTNPANGLRYLRWGYHAR